MANDAELRVKLHDHIWSILTDLAIDETLTDQEVDDAREAMEDLAELLIDSLNLEFVESESTDEGKLNLTVKLSI